MLVPAASLSPAKVPDRSPVYLDTETTGLDPRFDAIVEIAIVDRDGSTLLDTLINPRQPIPASATAIHGITDDDVSDAPLLFDVLEQVSGIIQGRELVIYNAPFDTAFLGLHSRDATCAMELAMRAMGVSRWPKLSAAAAWAGHEWSGKAHRALADALAARTVHLHALRVLAEQRSTPAFLRGAT